MIWEVYHMPGGPVKYRKAIAEGTRKAILLFWRACAFFPIGETMAAEGSRFKGSGERIDQPVRNPYERGTAGPIFWGVLPAQRASNFWRARSFFATNCHPPYPVRGAARGNASTGARPGARMRRDAGAERVDDAILDTAARLCFNGVSVRDTAPAIDGTTLFWPTQEHDMGKTQENAVEKTEVEGTPKRSKSEQMRKYKAGYESYQAANGSISMDNGDPIALALRGSSPEAVMAAAEKLKGLEAGTLATRYIDRNQGAKRMNSGNIIRGCVKRGDKTQAEVVAAIKAASKDLNTVTK